ncbi:MAG: hypothetical protein IM572_06280 [Chitinophagaceae bacterium]|jgi:hypothetical protein|nr:hypothetical protein [Microcystis sp. M065S1]MCA6492265.1 hypothetical protein [Chitinophagaceae bacterium]
MPEFSKKKRKYAYPFYAKLPPEKELLFKAIANKRGIRISKLTSQALIEFIEREALGDISN